MKKTKDDSPLSAFDGLLSNISGESYQGDSSDMDDRIIDKDVDGVADLSKSDDDVEIDITPLLEDDKADEDIKDDTATKDDDSEEESDLDDKLSKKNTKADKKPKVEEETEIDDTDAESSQVSLFFDAFSEALGWEAEDEEKKPTTIEDLIEYMREVVDENSTIEYADDRVKELDNFIKNGGKFEDYYTATSQVVDLDKIDITDEANQKSIVTEYLKESGYTDAQIKRRIERWEDAGVLEDEAADSIELLKEARSKHKDAIVKQQEQTRIQELKAQQEFYNDIQSNIDNLKEIRGIKVTAEDRKKLKDYSLKVDSDGKTKYLKEYEKNLSKNFIESAFFTMKGDAFIKTAKQSGESSAIARLKQSMKTNKVGGSKHEMDNSSATPIWEAASTFFKGK